LYNLDVKNDPNLVPISRAISTWRKKQPSIVKITVLGWIKDGLVKEVVEDHGHLKWHFIPKKEVSRVLKLIPTDWVQGQPMLKRPE